MLNPLWQNLAAEMRVRVVRPSPDGEEEGRARVVKGRGKKRKYEDSTAQAPSLPPYFARSYNRALVVT